MARVIASREFNQNVSRARRAAETELVIITDRGEPAHVLMSYAQFRELTSERPDIAELLVMREDTDFDPPRLDMSGFRVPDFS